MAKKGNLHELVGKLAGIADEASKVKDKIRNVGKTEEIDDSTKSFPPNLKKKILYIDMDSVLVDFIGAFNKLDKDLQEQYKNNKDEVPGMFGQMLPLEGALDAFDKLSEKYDVYILSSAPWENPGAWLDKLEWVKKYLGASAKKRLILSHHKNLNRGDYLIDDRPNNGADEFTGEWLHFGENGKYLNWKSVLNYLL